MGVCQLMRAAPADAASGDSHGADFSARRLKLWPDRLVDLELVLTQSTRRVPLDVGLAADDDRVAVNHPAAHDEFVSFACRPDR